MSTCKIGAPNWCEQTLCLITNNPLGSWITNPDGSSSILNVRDPDFDTFAISTNALSASTQWAMDLTVLQALYGSNPVGANCLFIPKHNLTQDASIIVKAGTAPFTTLGGGGGTIIYNSGTTFLPQRVYTAGLLPWGHANTWTGAPDPLIDASYNTGVLVDFGTTVVASYWWVGITDTTNPDGYVALARVFLGPYYQPLQNVQFGAERDLQGTRVADESVNNAEFVDPNRRLRRVWALTFDDSSVNEVEQVLMGLQHYLGYAKQALFIFDPSDTIMAGRRNFMFIIQKPGGIGYPYHDGGSLSLLLQEVI